MLTKIQSDLDKISSFDPSMWVNLKNKKIFATGCTGFLGTWIVYSFLHINKKYKLQAELCLLTRNLKKFFKNFPEDPSLSVVEGDIKDFDFPEGDFHYVIHGATEVSAFQNNTNPSELLDVSYRGSKRILEFGKSAKTKKILFLSSGAAYGPQPGNLSHLLEDYTGGPITNSSKSTYGEAKRLSEILLFNDSIPATSARIFAAAGPFLPMDSQYAFSNFLDASLKNLPIKINSNGKTTRSYLYAGDITLWLWTLLLKGRDKEIYNVGSEEEISVLDLAHAIKRVTKSHSVIEVLGTEVGFNRYIPSHRKIREEFKLPELVSLDESILKSFEFLKDQYAV